MRPKADVLEKAADRAKPPSSPTPLHIAAANHDFSEAERLLAAGADVEASNQIPGFTPLLAAILRRPEDVDRALPSTLWADACTGLGAGNGEGWLMLESFLYGLGLKQQGAEDPPSTLKMVDLLLSKGASPKAMAPYGLTALHLAAVMGSSSVVQVSP
jgi:ankyrin repeat protein